MLHHFNLKINIAEKEFIESLNLTFLRKEFFFDTGYLEIYFA